MAEKKTVEAYRYPVDVQIIVLLGLMFLTKETANPSLVQSAVVEYTCFLLSGFAVIRPYRTRTVLYAHRKQKRGCSGGKILRCVILLLVVVLACLDKKYMPS